MYIWSEFETCDPCMNVPRQIEKIVPFEAGSITIMRSLHSHSDFPSKRWICFLVYELEAMFALEGICRLWSSGSTGEGQPVTRWQWKAGFARFHDVSWVLWVLYEILSITVAARFNIKPWTVFARSNTGIMCSNPTWGMDVRVRLFCVYVILRVGSSLATGWSPVQGVLPNMCRLRNWKSGQGPRGL
jgi:hypothetical protein